MSSEQMVLAEKLTMRRARGSIVLGILFVSSMATSLNVDVGDSRPATIQIAAWVVWGVAIRILLSVAVGAAAIRFGILERRALKIG